jgi:hypothetical protein
MLLATPSAKTYSWLVGQRQTKHQLCFFPFMVATISIHHARAGLALQSLAIEFTKRPVIEAGPQR